MDVPTQEKRESTLLPPFCSIWPSMDRVLLTHSEEGRSLYSVCWVKCLSLLETPHRHAKIVYQLSGLLLAKSSWYIILTIIISDHKTLSDHMTTAALMSWVCQMHQAIKSARPKSDAQFCYSNASWTGLSRPSRLKEVTEQVSKPLCHSFRSHLSIATLEWEVGVQRLPTSWESWSWRGDKFSSWMSRMGMWVKVTNEYSSALSGRRNPQWTELHVAYLATCLMYREVPWGKSVTGLRDRDQWQGP
jgi:hypothetical protein